ncbi:MAG: hypothetical protein U1F56_16080 [Rubrivivax sp.]
MEHDAQALRAEQQRVAALAEALRPARGLAGGRLDPARHAGRRARRTHFQAQLAEVDAYRDRLLGQVAAFKSLGGGPAAAAPASDTSNAGEPS